jgi:hypothetical protein
MAEADIDDGKREGLSTDERKELVELRRQERVLEMEVEILKRASAFSQFSTTPAGGTRRSATSAPPTTKARLPLDAPPRPPHDARHLTRTVRKDRGAPDSTRRPAHRSGHAGPRLAAQSTDAR